MHSGNFYITDLYAADETELRDPSPIMNLHRKEGKRRAIFLRYRDRESGEVRVYPGKLQVSQPFCTVPVDQTTTITDLIRESLVHFDRRDVDAEEFRCSEVLLDRGGKLLTLVMSSQELLKCASLEMPTLSFIES